MIQYHLKKRIDIVVEVPLIRIITKKLDESRISGWTMLPVMQGRGMVNAWSSEGQISDTANMVTLFCILDPSQADGVIETILAAIKDRIGFMTISDVFVVRPDRF